MEQDERAVVDLSEVNTEKGGEATAPATATAAILASEVAKEGVSEVDGSVRGAASESAKKQDLEEPSPESDEVAAASGRIEKEDGEAFDNPAVLRSRLPSSSDRRLPILMRFTAAGDAEQADSEAAVLGASSSSAPAPASGTHLLEAGSSRARNTSPGRRPKLRPAPRLGGATSSSTGSSLVLSAAARPLARSG